MAESANRPIAAELYRTPADSGAKAQSNYRPPGQPAPREPEATLGVRRNSQAHTTEPASAPPRAQHETDPAVTHPVGADVVHRVSGQHGTVVGHATHGYGTALPHVVWEGEEKSWPQGVSANAVRVVGSTPEDLYQNNQDAASSRPLNRHTGAQ